MEPRRLRLLWLWLCMCSLVSVGSAVMCDGSCSGHGACDGSTGRCQCFAGYVGVSCKSMSCPQGVAWADYATATDTAHAMTECSNMGSCDRTSGQCRCVSGFEGPACERMSCPPCLYGRCVSMREAAQLNDGTNFLIKTTYNMWDADKIFGCQCDNGFSGWDCSQRECPKGDDPLTTGQVDEVQRLNCVCDVANGCTGSFALTFRRRTTANLLPTSTAADVKKALEALDTIVQVAVSVSTGSPASPVCDFDGATTSITFTNNPGSLPDLKIQNRLTVGGIPATLTLTSGGSTLGVFDSVPASVRGTREEAYCSNRGVCDFNTGLCTCMVGFASSNGAGAAGTRGDCGLNEVVPTGCPVTSTGICNLKGSCSNAPLWQCVCIVGYTGPDCTLRTCPKGLAWFDGATSANQAHAMVECSNKGSCDTKTGLCACHALFTGSACEVLKCPNSGSTAATVCSGHGVCKTMEMLAQAATTSGGDPLGVTYGATINNPATWDYNKIQGCDCSDGYYMGPYSSAFGEFRDYDCSSRFCPVGADPYETSKVNEIQTLSCKADGGTFTLTFRQQTTAAIAFSANAATIKTELEKLSSVRKATVVIMGGGASVCGPTTAVSTTIEFTFTQGDVPMVILDSSLLTLTAGAATMSVSETQKGTKANIECSSRGLCDRATGVCKCFNYFLSSNGDGAVGTRGDCGYLASYPTIATA